MAAAQPAARHDDRPETARRIWLVADDYGISRSVNAAIRDLLERGAINATSVMVVASGFDTGEAEKLLGSRAHGAIGLHLTLTAPFRPSLSGYEPTRNAGFFSLRDTFLAAVLGRLSTQMLTAEIESQVAKFVAAFGRPPDFIDGHQHVHLFPRIDACLLSVVRRTVPGAWVRQCGRAPRSPLDRKALVLDLLSRRFRSQARARGVATNPAFAGTYNFAATANFAELFPAFLNDLPDGAVIMCHPGTVDEELVRNDTLTSLRESEYAFLGSDAFRRLLSERRYVLMEME